MPQFFNPRLYRFLGDEFSWRPLDDVPGRDDIRDRLTQLHRLIDGAPNSPLRVRDLYAHWRPENLTNLIDLSPFNGNRVSEIYVRYGKSRQQITAFGEIGEPPSVLPHVHISFGLNSESFFFTLVFNQDAWLDYQHLRGILAQDRETAIGLMDAVRELGRAGYHLWGPGMAAPLSSFDTAGALLRALPLAENRRTTEDKVGMSRDYSPEDPGIDQARIVHTSLNEISRLWPIFNTVALRQPPSGAQ